MSKLKQANLVPLKAVIYRILDSLPKDVISEDRIEEWAYQAYESLAPDEMYQ